MTVVDHSHVAELVSLIEPLDAIEARHRQQVLGWIGSGAPLYRLRKPDHPPQHLVAYFVVTDLATGNLLLVDHINAGLRLPTGGHCEPGEPPWQTVQRECGEELDIAARETAWLGRRPLFVTVTPTRDPHGTLGVHTDVSLWFVVEAAADTVTAWDRTEFSGLHWMSPDQILATPLEQLDPHLHRFIAKYQSARPALDAAHLRERMVDRLMVDRHLTTDEVATAMRAVPREHFMPDGVDLATPTTPTATL